MKIKLIASFLALLFHVILIQLVVTDIFTLKVNGYNLKIAILIYSYVGVLGSWAKAFHAGAMKYNEL